MTTRLRGPRRRTRWIDSLENLTLGSGLQDEVTLLGPLGADDVHGMTITRIIVNVDFYANAPAIADGAQRIDMGIGVGDTEAFGSGSLPDPETGTDEPPLGWLWRSSKTLLDHAGEGPIDKVTIDLDLRSQRKLYQRAECYFILTSTPVQGTSFTIRMSGLFRLLMKLP